MKQKTYIAGLYYRLSQEDERQGESASIENQRVMLRKYAEEQGFNVFDEYIDDGISGTTFNRPSVQRLLDDAKTGVINTIIVKDLSRFGRNYIEVGQYLDYVFPAFGIRFIAVQDNIDTANRDSSAMEMMPIMNVFNEWHAANTSKKLKAVWRAKAQEGIFHNKKASYGYIKGNDFKRTLIIDEETAPIVKRIFEMYASGNSPMRIAETLNSEGIPSPAQYAFDKLGHKGKPNEQRLWTQNSIAMMLKKLVYLGHMPQLMTTTISHKNHKAQRKDESAWVIVYNTHPPIISQELWDKVRAREKSVAQGKRTKIGFTPTLSGFVFCADCGTKLKLAAGKLKNSTYKYAFNCGNYLRFGKTLCFFHFIQTSILEEIILDDIRTMAQRIVLDEDAIREEFIKHNAELADKTIKSIKKELQSKQRRLEELNRLIKIAYEDKMKGKMPEDICIEFIQQYSNEQKAIEKEIADIESKLNEIQNTKQTADEFIQNIKKYLNAPTLTREMCYELIDRVVVSGLPKITGKDRTIDIVYKVDIASVLRYKLNK